MNIKIIFKINQKIFGITIEFKDTVNRKVELEKEISYNDFYDVEIIKPIPPQKPSNKNPIINIEFVPGSFKELAIYDGLKFEVISKLSVSQKIPFESKKKQLPPY